MKVFSYLDPDGSDLDFKLIPIWEESWRRQGWTPRLLTIRDAKKNKFFKPSAVPQVYAWAQVGGGWFSDIHLINFSFRPKQLRCRIGYGLGLVWGTKSGAEEHARLYPGCREGVTNYIDKNLRGAALVSCFHCENMERVQEFLDQCSAARKKS